MSIKKWTALSTSTAVIASIASPVVAHAEKIEFEDLKEGDSYYTEISELAEKQIINGYPDGTFKPSNTLLRAHGAKLFARALKLQVPDNALMLLDQFSDVNVESDIAPFVAAVEGRNILPDMDEFRAGDPLTREDMATWLVRAFNLNPIDHIEVPLTDLDEISPENLENVKIIYQHGITTGKADGTYGPKETVNRGHFAVFLHRAMNQTIISIDDFDDISIKKGTDSLDLPNQVEVGYVNGGTALLDVSWDTTTIDFHSPGSYKLKGNIAGSSYDALITIHIEEIELTVDEVRTDSLKQVQLILNHKDFDRDVLSNIKAYEFSDSDGKPIKVTHVDVEENIVTLTLNQSEMTRLFISITSDVLTTKEPIVFDIRDVTVPKVDSVKAVSPTLLKVGFSEPMNFKTEDGEPVTNRDIKGAFKIENNYIKNVTPDSQGTIAYVEFYNTFKDGTYTLNIQENLRDYFGFRPENKDFSFTFSEDTTQIELIKVKDVYPNRATLVFNKELEIDIESNPDLLNDFHHTNRGINATRLEQTARNEITVKFDQQNPFPDTAVIYIDKGALTDLWGNENEFLRKGFSIDIDEVPPSLEKVQLVEQQNTSSSYIQFDVTFSEPVNQESAEMLENYQLLTSSGELVPLKFVKLKQSITNEVNDQVVTLTIDRKYGELKGDTYQLLVDRLTDLYGNSMAVQTIAFEAESESRPGDFTANLNAAENEIYLLVDFGREMETSSTNVDAVNLTSKYALKVDSSDLLLETLSNEKGIKVDLNTYEEGQKVEIVIRKDRYAEGDGVTFFNLLKQRIDGNQTSYVDLIIGRVADKDGTKTSTFFNHATLTIDREFGLASDTIAITSPTEFSMTLDDPIERFYASDIIVYADKDEDEQFDADEYLGRNIAAEYGKDTIKVTLNEPLSGDATFDSNKVFVTVNKNASTQNRYGQSLAFDQILLQDQILPEIKIEEGVAQVYVDRVIGDPNTALVKLTFTEKMDAETITKLSFTVGGGKYRVLSTRVDNAIVSLIVDLNGDEVVDLIGETVKQTSPISDMNYNIVNDIEVFINPQ